MQTNLRFSEKVGDEIFPTISEKLGISMSQLVRISEKEIQINTDIDEKKVYNIILEIEEKISKGKTMSTVTTKEINEFSDFNLKLEELIFNKARKITDEQIAKMQGMLNESKAVIESLRSEISAAKKAVDATKTEKAALEKTVEEMNQRLLNVGTFLIGKK